MELTQGYNWGDAWLFRLGWGLDWHLEVGAGEAAPLLAAPSTAPSQQMAQQSPKGDALAEDTHPPEFNLINCVLFSHRGFRAEQTF